MVEYTKRVQDRMWTGLINPKAILCTNLAACTDKLAWLSDGSSNDVVPTGLQKLEIWFKDFCVLHKESQGWNRPEAEGANCDTRAPFACEYRCDGNRGGKLTIEYPKNITQSENMS